MFTHRGAWINAVGEVVEHQLTQRSVYLWTLPLFHCNGWCFSWAVTAAGGRHICMRQPDPAEAVAPDRSRRRDPPLRRAGGRQLARAVLCRERSEVSQSPAHHHRRRAAAARRDPRSRRDRRGDHPRLRTHRDLRSAHHLRLEARLGRPARRRTRPAQSPPGRALPDRRHRPAGDRPQHERRPRRRRDHGRSTHARQQRHAGLLRQSQGHRGGLPGRLVPLRRPRRGPSGRLHRTARPHEGHRHLRRREHLFHRSGEGAGRSSSGRRSRHRGGRRREMGRGAQGLRRAQARTTPPPPTS